MRQTCKYPKVAKCNNLHEIEAKINLMIHLKETLRVPSPTVSNNEGNFTLSH